MFVRILVLVLILMAGQISLASAQGSRDVNTVRLGKTVSASGLAGSGPAVVLANQKRQNRDVHVTMYMTNWCPYCNKARAYLKELGVNLTEYDIEKDSAKRAEMKKLSGGSTGVPLINVEGIIIPGFAPDAIYEAVEKRKNSEVKG